MDEPSRDARMVALRALGVLDGGAFAQFAIQEESHRAGLDSRDTRFVRELVLGTERWRALLDDMLSPHLRKGLSKTDPVVLRILRLAAYQLHFMDRVPARAAIHSAVEMCRSTRGEGLTRFVNGVLRSLQRSDYAPPASLSTEDLAVRLSHPEWMIQRYLVESEIDEVIGRCAANNRPAPLTIRCRKSTRETLVKSLEAEGATVRETDWSPFGLHVSGHPSPFSSDSFKAGEWVAQDEASQLAVLMLGDTTGTRVWDVCAAPGGKTEFLVDLGDAESIFATDSAPKKIKRLQHRLGHSANCVVHDARQDLAMEGGFDRVLLDAPCTAMGLIHRHPEIRWRRSPGDIEDRVDLQRAILSRVADQVNPGGVLVYSVCSDTPEEGPEQIRAFLARRPDFRVEAPIGDDANWDILSQEGWLKTRPDLQGCDGFFAARLMRREKR